MTPPSQSRCGYCGQEEGHSPRCSITKFGAPEMRVTEMWGLKTILTDAVERGTLHAIAPPPDREDFISLEAYDRAYAEWERKGLWTGKNIGDA